MKNINDYIQSIKEQQGEMSKNHHYNNYYNQLLQDVKEVITEIADDSNFYDEESRKLMKEIILKLSDYYCKNSEDCLNLINWISTL